ncbi:MULTISPECIES: type IV pilin [Methanobrevibacter]|uniref:Uncharacterized protein DUF1628 n=1 Tax=Methanobrevibacter gottschalkii DSM 11977 TaxID=1122229 RepID=A0A3N5BC96_9EURY|nr:MULTISPECIES: type IV pilin [Methanobrevibacter]OEC99207.1 hypothetical protein A9505_04040 [Methanobrevibacter sp. A27]RPF53030.1 uncharacterized protein DUF1628 [Methanobrevibacter gottschalkii DSM 11977]
MNKKIIIAAIIVVIIAVVAGFMLTSSNSQDNSKITIMGNGSIHENGTIGIKLTNGENTALKNKTVHVCVKDSEGKIVVDKTAKTYVNGVVGVRLTNVSAGEYDVNVTFEGDENYTSSSVSQKLKIIAGESDDDPTYPVDEDTVTTTADASSTQSSQSSSQSQSYTPSRSNDYGGSSSSDDDGGLDADYDENGNEMLPTVDEEGNEVSN